MDCRKTAGSLLNAGCAGAVVAAVPAAFLWAFAGDTPASTEIPDENRRGTRIESWRSAREFARSAKGNRRSRKCEAADSFVDNLRNRARRLRTRREQIFKRRR